MENFNHKFDEAHIVDIIEVTLRMKENGTSSCTDTMTLISPLSLNMVLTPAMLFRIILTHNPSS